jgi:ribosomal protein L19
VGCAHRQPPLVVQKLSNLIFIMKLQEIVRTLEARQEKKDLPSISIGDTVRVGVFIQEGNKQRLQPYEGTVIAQLEFIQL